ncbi:MAG: tRNA uracil 4-sulfurtransferase ThiI [archaeon]
MTQDLSSSGVQHSFGNNVVLVSASELILKSPYVRSSLHKSLFKDLTWKLRRAKEDVGQISLENGRIIIQKVKNPDVVAELCAKVFGVSVTCSARELPSERDALAETASQLASNRISPGQTFAVRARVVGNHTFHTEEIEREIGKKILDALSPQGTTVDLDDPDRTIYLEIRESHSYLYSERKRGLGGLPYGTQGRLIALVSGGIDSPVAAWMMMKRGAHVIPVFMDMKPFAGEDYKEKAIQVVEHLREYAPIDEFRMLVAPFGSVAEHIMKLEPRFRCILCKRMMYRISCSLARDKRALAVVTGESVGQVASQTLHNLSVLSEAADLPILRPLIGMDKEEIQDLARRIGTYPLSVQKAHGCTLVPSTPSTSANIGKIDQIEKELNVNDLVQESLKKTEIITL